MLEKSAIPNNDSLNSDPSQNNRPELSKSASSNKVKNIMNEVPAVQPKAYQLSKSTSGGNIQINGNHTNEQTSSSASAISSPSNNSPKEEGDK